MLAANIKHQTIDNGYVHSTSYIVKYIQCTMYIIKCGDRTELRSARNFETHVSSKRTELQNSRNFEAHGTLKHTEL